MGKNSDIESISNSLSIIILHELLIEHSDRQESINHLKKEVVEYRGQSIKKINRIRLNENDKKIIRNKVIRKINNRLKTKYSDIQVSQRIISKKVDKSLYYFFEYSKYQNQAYNSSLKLLVIFCVLQYLYFLSFPAKT